MPVKIGVLLPRSTDYPAMGYDMLDGIRAAMLYNGITDIQLYTENIGFGEDADLNHAKAEKLLLQEGVHVIIMYSNVQNAEPLYSLATAVRKPFIFLDAGMQLPMSVINEYCYHISMQGAHACYLAGEQAAKGGRKVLVATSFYDGGYRGPWSYHSSIEMAGGSVCGNYVSGYKEAEFSIHSYLQLLEHTAAEGVAACFSLYLSRLFMQSLKQAGAHAVSVPFWCAPYMAEEQLLAQCDFPGGNFHAYVPWNSTLNNEEQHIFTAALVQTEKPVNLFHLFGWEAVILVKQFITNGAGSLRGFSYNSPRGNVQVHQSTHHTYAPLHYGNIIESDNGKCRFKVEETVALKETDHTYYLACNPGEAFTGWRNNYFCI